MLHSLNLRLIINLLFYLLIDSINDLLFFFSKALIFTKKVYFICNLIKKNFNKIFDRNLKNDNLKFEALLSSSFIVFFGIQLV